MTNLKTSNGYVFYRDSINLDSILQNNIHLIRTNVFTKLEENKKEKDEKKYFSKSYGNNKAKYK